MAMIVAEQFSGRRDKKGRSRRNKGRSSRTQPRPEPLPHHSPAPKKSKSPRRWGGFLHLGRNVRIQAAQGYRAIVTEVQPGLYMVAEVPSEQVVEFGSVALATFATKALTKAIAKGLENPEGTKEKAQAIFNKSKGIFQKIVKKQPAAHEAEEEDYIEAEYVEVEDEEDFAGVGLLPAPLRGRAVRWLPAPAVSGHRRRC